MLRSVITGTGSYIPSVIKRNQDFPFHNFYSESQIRIETAPAEISEKFRQITGIEERRYAPPELNSSDIGTQAALRAIDESGIDIELLDQIIVAHNFGNVIDGTFQTE